MKIVIESEPKETAELLQSIEARPEEKKFSVLIDARCTTDLQKEIRKYSQEFGQKRDLMFAD